MGSQSLEMGQQQERRQAGAGRRSWSCPIVIGLGQGMLSRLDGLGVGPASRSQSRGFTCLRGCKSQHPPPGCWENLRGGQGVAHGQH